MEENKLGNNTGIKQTHVVKPIKNQQFNLPMKSYEVIEYVCFTYTYCHVSFCYCYDDG